MGGRAGKNVVRPIALEPISNIGAAQRLYRATSAEGERRKAKSVQPEREGALGGRAGYDVVPPTANGALHYRQDRTTSIPGNLGKRHGEMGATGNEARS